MKIPSLLNMTNLIFLGFILFHKTFSIEPKLITPILTVTVNMGVSFYHVSLFYVISKSKIHISVIETAF